MLAATRWLLLGLWAAALLNVLAPGLGVARLAWPALALFVCLAIIRARMQTRFLCLLLALIAGALAVAGGVPEAIPLGFEKGLLFAAFMPSLILLRQTADQRHEAAGARAIFAGLPADRRGSGLMVGAHVLGAALNIGILAILAPVIGREGDEGERLRFVSATLRGQILAVLWSPFTIGMGLVTSYLPGPAYWRIVLLGGALAMAGIAVSAALFDRAGGWRAVVSSAASLVPVVPPILVATLSVAILGAAFGLSTLAALIVVLPPLCALALLTERGARPRFAAVATFEGLSTVAAEVAVLTLALVLGTVLDTAMGSGALSPPSIGPFPPIVVYAFAAGTVIVAAALAVHPIVSATVVLVVILALPQELDPLPLTMAVLIGWALGSMVSITGIAIATASALYALPPERLIRGPNALFVAVFGALAILLLGGADALLG